MKIHDSLQWKQLSRCQIWQKFSFLKLFRYFISTQDIYQHVDQILKKTFAIISKGLSVKVRRNTAHCRVLIRAFADVKMSTKKIISWRDALMRPSNIEIVPNCHYRDKWPHLGIGDESESFLWGNGIMVRQFRFF